MSCSAPMSARAFAALAAGLALLASPRTLLAEETLEGKRVVVACPAGLEETAAACRDALEAAIPVYEKALPYRLPAEERLVLRLCGTSEEYQAIVKDLAPDLLDNNAATIWKTRESLIVVVPRADERLMALTKGIPDATRFLACHEGVHQFLMKSGAKGAEAWPAWYAEGMADHLATECLLAVRRTEDPPAVLLDDRAHLVREAVLRDRALSLPRLLHTDATAFEDKRSLYAQAWSLFRLLATDGERLRALYERVKALPDLPEGGPGPRAVAAEAAFEAALKAAYGPLGPLEKRWRERAKGAQISWFEGGRASQALSGGRFVCAAYEGSGAQLLSAAPPPAPSFELSCTLTIFPGKKRQADLILGYEHREAPRFVKIALGSDGYATLLAYSDGRWQGRYRVNAEVPPDTFAEGVAVPVRVVVDGGRVILFVRGEMKLDAPVPPGFDLEHAAWGAGAWDCVVLYEGLHVAALAK